MFLRNLTMFCFPNTIDFSEIATCLPHCALRDVGPLEMHSSGFVSPFGREETEQLFHIRDSWLWLTVGGKEKVLPASVIADRLEDKIASIERSEGRMPGGRERKRIKDDLLHDLLPAAMVKSTRTDVFLDTNRGVAFIGSSSRKAAESVVSHIRGALGSFPAMPLNAEIAPRSVLTGWLAGEALPRGVALGEECKLEDPVAGGAVVHCQNQELLCDEIDRHIEAGKQATQLALVFDDCVSFVLGDDLSIKKLRFLDGAMDKLSGNGDDGIRAELDARFTLQTSELGRVFDVLAEAFRVTPAN